VQGKPIAINGIGPSAPARLAQRYNDPAATPAAEMYQCGTKSWPGGAWYLTAVSTDLIEGNSQIIVMDAGGVEALSTWMPSYLKCMVPETELTVTSC